MNRHRQPLSCLWMIGFLSIVASDEEKQQKQSGYSFNCVRTNPLLITSTDWCQLNCGGTGCAGSTVCYCVPVSGTWTATSSVSPTGYPSPTSVSKSPSPAPSNSSSASPSPSVSSSVPDLRKYCVGNPGWVSDEWCSQRCEFPNWATYCCWAADYKMTIEQVVSAWPTAACNCMCPPRSVTPTPSPSPTRSPTPTSSDSRSASRSISGTNSGSITPSISPTASVPMTCVSIRDGVTDASCQSCVSYPRDETSCSHFCSCIGPTPSTSPSASTSLSVSVSISKVSTSPSPSPIYVVEVSSSRSATPTHRVHHSNQNQNRTQPTHLPARGWHPFQNSSSTVSIGTVFLLVAILLVTQHVLE